MFKRILLVAGSSVLINTAVASEGAYVAANVGYANISNWWTASLAVTVNGGYNFNNYFATEAGFTWINPIAIGYPGSSGISGSYTTSQSFVDVAAKGSLPFSDIFNVYIKGGLAAGFTGSDASSNAALGSNWAGSSSSGVSPGLYLALGGEFKLSNHFQLLIEDYGILPFGGANYGNVNVMGIGAKYNF